MGGHAGNQDQENLDEPVDPRLMGEGLARLLIKEPRSGTFEPGSCPYSRGWF
jgi:hypothetical protein